MGIEGNCYKLFWQRCKEGIVGVGVLVHQKWIENVIEVKRLNEQILTLSMVVGKHVPSVGFEAGILLPGIPCGIPVLGIPGIPVLGIPGMSLS